MSPVGIGPQSNESTRLSYILGVPLAPDAERQWPQMGEVVRTRDPIAKVEGNFPELTLEVGRRLHLDDNVLVVEWTCNYGDGRLCRNVTIAELRNGEAKGSATTGARPPPPPTGVAPSRIASTCPPTASGKTTITWHTTDRHPHPRRPHPRGCQTGHPSSTSMSLKIRWGSRTP